MTSCPKNLPVASQCLLERLRFSDHDSQGILWFGSCLTFPPCLLSWWVSSRAIYSFCFSVSAIWNDLLFSQFATISGCCAFVQAALLHGKLSTSFYSLHLTIISLFLKIQPVSYFFLSLTPQAMLGLPHHPIYLSLLHWIHSIRTSSFSQYHALLFISKFS